MNDLQRSGPNATTRVAWDRIWSGHWYSDHRRRLRRSAYKLDAIQSRQGSRKIGSAVCEIGCGAGYFLAELVERYPQIEAAVGCDHSLTALKRAKLNFGADRRIQFVACDVRSLPFAAQKFDAVFAICSLEHIHNMRTVVEEAWRILEPNGDFFLFFSNRLSFFTWERRVKSLIGEWPYSFQQEITVAALKQLLAPRFSPTGWSVLRAKEIFPSCKGWTGWRIDFVILGVDISICTQLEVKSVINFVLGVLSSVIAAVLLAVVVRLQIMFSPTLRPAWNIFKSINRLRKSGIVNIITSRSEYSFLKGRETIPRYLLKSVNHSLIYIGFWHAKGVEMENLRNVFVSLASKGCSIEMVLLDPEIDDERVSFMAKHLGLSATSFRNRLSDAWTEMTQYQSNIPTQFKRNFVLKAHTEVIHSSAFVMDLNRPSACTLVDFKLFGTEREGAFAFELMPTNAIDSLYLRVTESFMVIRDAARARNASLQVITNGRK